MREFLHSFTGLCLIRLMADMALPEGDARRYADLGAALLTMLWMLRAAVSLARGFS